VQVFFWILIVVVGYVFGNLNGAILISKYLMHDDVRKHGSGNAGLTNYFRTYGGFQSLLVIVIDVLKCVAACLIAQLLLPDDALHAKMVAGASCIVGHCFPAAAGFRGGKGILCGAALAGCTDWRVLVIILSVFILTIVLTRFVSLGSVMAATTFVICYFVFHWGDWLSLVLALAAAGFVIYRHNGNIVRLLKGTESKLSFHKK